ncbi:hypothetical protein ACLOJK_004833 [Asimina triloba]
MADCRRRISRFMHLPLLIRRLDRVYGITLLPIVGLDLGFNGCRHCLFSWLPWLPFDGDCSLIVTRFNGSYEDAAGINPFDADLDVR